MPDDLFLPDRGERPRRERGGVVSFYMPSSQIDRLIVTARVNRKTVSEYLRDLVAVQIAPRPKA